jgi:hydrogenase nickel incorporation protein HypA/HybF
VPYDAAVHELALAHSISRIVTRAAAGRRVTRVAVDCGALRQVVPETLAYCWDLVVEDSPLAGAAMAVTAIPAVVECADCGATTVLDRLPILRCDTCQSVNVSLTSGEEFLVRSIDVE